MSIKQCKSSHDDVITELLSLCDLRVEEIALRQGTKGSSDCQVQTQRLGPIMKILFQKETVHVNWQVRRANIHPFFDNLPQELVWEGSQSLAEICWSISKELKTPQPGGSLVRKSLAEILFIFMIRDFAKVDPNYRTPIRVPQIFRSIKLIHKNPEKNWAVETLARQVGVSRATFYRQFVEAIGIPPYDYIKKWRVVLAQKELLNQNLSLEDIALWLGYSGAASFSRSFKEVVGMSPKNWRDQKEKDFK